MMTHNSCTFHTCAQLCDATVDLAAQSVPQVVRPEESLRVQDVSEDPANLYHRLELSTNVVAAERDKFPTSMQVLTCCSSEQVTLDVDATDWFGGSGELSSFKSPAYRSGDRVTQ